MLVCEIVMNRPSHVRPRDPLDARKTYIDVTTDDDFEANRERFGFPQAFAVTASALVEMGTHDSGYRMPSVDRLHVAATVGGYVRGQARIRSGTLPSGECRRILKADVIPFNRALSALIDNDNTITRPELVSYLATLYRNIHKRESPDHYAEAVRMIHDTATGMAEENIAEQLAYACGFETKPASVEADLAGADMFMQLYQRWRPVNIKSSRQAAMNARIKRPDMMTVWTHVNMDSLGGAFRLPESAIPTYVGAFQHEVESEWSRVYGNQ